MRTRALLSIRQEQIEALKEYMYKRFESFMLGYLRKLFPQACEEMGDEGLCALIRKGTDEAVQYGIEVYREIAQYTSLKFFLSDDFATADKYPWAREILTNKTMPASEKVELLLQRTKEELKR